MIKNIIFDWSGVINDNLESTYKAGMAVLEFCGVPKMSLKQYREEWVQPYMEFYNRYCPNLTNEEQKPVYNNAIKKCAPPKPYPGIDTFIKQCHEAGRKIIVISSDHVPYIEDEAERFSINNHIDKIYGGVHDKVDGLKKALDDLQIDPKETIFIGDTTHEVEAAKKFGVISGSVTWGIHTEGKLKKEKTDYIFNGIEDMNKVIFSENEPK